MKRSMRLGLLLALTVIVAAGVAWMSAGRSLTAFADRLVTVPISVSTPSIHKIIFDGDFRMGDLSLTSGALNNYPFDLTLSTNPSRMVVLTSGGRSFVLGPRTNPIDTSGRPDIDFLPERGDTVSLTATRSLLGWPTPFEYTIMVSNPSWKRYVYYRLVWRKRTGAELVMRWRYEQDYFSGRGWIHPAMMWDFHTGLINVDIGP